MLLLLADPAQVSVSWTPMPSHLKILHQGLLRNDGFGSSGRMQPVQTFSDLFELPSLALTLKTLRCRKQAGPLQRKQNPPSGVANWREQTDQRHLMDSQATTFD